MSEKSPDAQDETVERPREGERGGGRGLVRTVLAPASECAVLATRPVWSCLGTATSSGQTGQCASFATVTLSSLFSLR